MDIIHVAAKIFLVAEGVSPIPALPYSAFAFAVRLASMRSPFGETRGEIHMSEALDRTIAWDARKALLRRGVGASRLSVAAEGPPPP